MKEVDLAKKVVDWLHAQHWEVWQEVEVMRHCGVHDIIAVRNRLVWIIECKTRFSFKLLQQAHRAYAHYRSVAVPTSRGNDFTDCVAAKFNIGVIRVDNESWRSHGIHEVVSPPLQRQFHRFRNEILRMLEDIPRNYADAGSPGNNHFTPWRGTMARVKKFLQMNPGATLKEICDEVGKAHYSSETSAKANIRKSLTEFVDWCRVEKEIRTMRFYVKEN